MTGRRIFHLVYTILLTAAYILVWAYLMPLDAMQYISLLFSTLAVSVVYFVPIVYPKKGKGYGRMRAILYFITILYAALVLLFSYLFSFEYTLDGTTKFIGMVVDEKFYFLVHTIAFCAVMVIVFFNLGTPKAQNPPEMEKKEEEHLEEAPPAAEEAEAQERTVPSALPADVPEEADDHRSDQ